MSHSEIPEHGAIIWTSVGIARQTRNVEDLASKYRALVAEMHDNNDGKIVVSETESADQGTLKTEKGMLKDTWDNARVLLGRLRPAPPSTSFDRACTNRIIKVKYLDQEVIERRGETEVFLLGGIGETDSDAKLRTYSVNSPLGSAVKGREVGEVCLVRIPHGQEYEVEIVSISALDKASEVLAGTQGHEPVASSSRLSIMGTVERAVKAA